MWPTTGPDHYGNVRVRLWRGSLDLIAVDSRRQTVWLIDLLVVSGRIDSNGLSCGRKAISVQDSKVVGDVVSMTRCFDFAVDIIPSPTLSV